MSDSQQTAVNKYGFIVMTDEGALFGTLSGMTKEILHQFSVELPKNRWPLGNKPPMDRATARRAWIDYVKKIADLATQFYIDQDTREPNISGLILAGYEFLMKSLTRDGMLNPALEAKVLCRAVVSYADDSGFNHAINLSSDYIADVKFVQEKRLIRNFFAEALGCKRGDKWNCTFGVEQTLKALELGAVKRL
ncbi:eukaryotic peptide chain release factor subunit 1-3-like [Papaver somniferum]|uniref:eukaryotic peptide chain release factor subunit 1-3-like n=1 Tax=Papaver somniferum TaxID=3469 RepID=UPI000E6FE0B5|nr:eukaryotic peptide chain release factor subunit 1-3-like [Papaver somniferum]